MPAAWTRGNCSDGGRRAVQVVSAEILLILWGKTDERFLTDHGG